MPTFAYILKQVLCFGYLEPPRIENTLPKCIRQNHLILLHNQQLFTKNNVSLQQLENYWESGILSSKVISPKLHLKVLIYQCQKITTQQMNNVIERNIKRSLTK